MELKKGKGTISLALAQKIAVEALGDALASASARIPEEAILDLMEVPTPSPHVIGSCSRYALPPLM